MGSSIYMNRARPEMPFQTVYVNGSVRRDIECAGISSTMGISGTQATFVVPAAFWGSGIQSALRNAVVVVYRGHRNQSPGFRGIVDIDNAQLDAQTNNYSFQGRSFVSLLDFAYPGVKNSKPEVAYNATLSGSNLPSGWTLSLILRDLFSVGEFPSQWRSEVKLGSIAAVKDFEWDVVMPDLNFSEGYRKTLLVILQTAGGRLSIREEFTANNTRLRFFLMGDGASFPRTIRIPSETEGASRGALVPRAEFGRDTRGVYSRVVGFGAPKETMITPYLPIGAIQPTAPIEPAWASATPYTDESGEFTAAETAVLKSPDSARPGSSNYVEGYEDVFQLFRLPRVLRQFEIDKVNAYEDTVDGQPRRISIQAFMGKYDYTDIGTGGVAKTGVLSTSEWELVPVTIEPEGYFRLAKPAIAQSQINYDLVSFVQSYIWSRVPVFIAITIRDRGAGPFYDTGVRGSVYASSLSNEGHVYKFNNPNYRYAVAGGTFTDEDNSEHTFPTLFWRESTKTWVLVDGESPEVIQDNRSDIAQLCEAWLGQRDAERITGTVWLPALAGLLPGDVVRFKNTDSDNIPMTVTSVQETLIGEEYGTRFTCSTHVPEMFNLGNAKPGAVSGLGLNSAPQMPAPQASMSYNQAKGAADRAQMQMIGGSNNAKMANSGEGAFPAESALGNGAMEPDEYKRRQNAESEFNRQSSRKGIKDSLNRDTSHWKPPFKV